MLTLLHPHPTCASGSVSKISVDARRNASCLFLHYSLEGGIANLRIPPPKVPERADRLWEHTCFEAFVRAGDGNAYTELNFAPSGQWAAYEFSNTRTGMTTTKLDRPKIEIWSDHASLHLKVEIAGLRQAGAWRLSLSAAIEEASGRKSYWALAHPSIKPDFHHPRSFTLVLP